MRFVLWMVKRVIPLYLLAGVSLAIGAGPQDEAGGLNGQPQFNCDEAECVLAIVAKNHSGMKIEPSDWQRLFASEPYVRLKKREAEIGLMFKAPERALTDEKFREFVLGAELGQRAADLRRVLQEWKETDINAIAKRILVYLPVDARIKAKIYPVIKPMGNSFVYEVNTDPAIFLYLDPQRSREQFENTVAHELHHIGFASIESRLKEPSAAATTELTAAVKWLGAFGEGFAMLAAAGGPDADPHRYSPEADRVRWQKDMANFNDDLGKVEKFFLDVLAGRFESQEKIDQAGFSFFGVQGPWYTVGYKMAMMVEKYAGRAMLIRCMEEPRLLLQEYNRLAAMENKGGAKLALWSPELLAKIGI
jgi:hypothetical protein